MSIILWPHQDHLMCTHSNDDHGMSTSAGNLYQDNSKDEHKGAMNFEDLQSASL